MQFGLKFKLLYTDITLPLIKKKYEFGIIKLRQTAYQLKKSGITMVLLGSMLPKVIIPNKIIPLLKLANLLLRANILDINGELTGLEVLLVHLLMVTILK